jgi:hypothetical protein
MKRSRLHPDIRKPQLHVPDGYFEALEERLREIPEQHAQPAGRIRQMPRFLLALATTAAAVFLAVWLWPAHRGGFIPQWEDFEELSELALDDYWSPEVADVDWAHNDLEDWEVEYYHLFEEP